jgi:endonuclease-3
MEWRPRLDTVSELVFTILSQHTSDTNAERAGEGLKARFGSWDAVAEASVEEVEEAIRSAGLARQKAPRILGTLQRVLELRGTLDLDFLAELPLAEAKAWLRELPGVGPKTAAVVLCFALGMPALAVDTHVHRVTRRLGLIGPKVTAEQAHDILEPLVPPEEVYAFHVGLITHGRQVCHARRPECGRCPLREGCPSRRE